MAQLVSASFAMPKKSSSEPQLAPKSNRRAKDAKQAPPPAAKRARGRPTVYTREVADLICRRMAGGMSLRQACADDGIPPASTVRGWVVDDVDGFAERYARARMLLAEHWADELVDIADDSASDWIQTSDGERLNSDHVQRSRLRVDTRKWIVSKMLPKVYGDKLDLNHGVQPDNPLAKLAERVMGTPMKPKA